MRRRAGAFAAAVAAATLGVLAIAPPITDGVWVATTGNDSATGTRGAPWLTVAHAVSALRSAGKTNATINVRSGTYYRTAVSLTDQDRGLTIKSHDGNGRADLVGGYKIDYTGCTIVSGSIYQCPIGVSDDPHALYEDGVPLELARSPNSIHNAQYPAQLGPFYVATDSGGTYHTTLGYSAGDVNLAGITASDVVVLGRSLYTGTSFGWWWEIDPVSSINTGTHLITLTNAMKYNSWSNGVGMNYILAGSCSWLDAVGEWCKNTTSHYVRLWPRAAIATTEIVVPIATDVVRVVGTDTSHLATGISLRGLTIRGSDLPAAYTLGAWGKDIPFPVGTPGGPDWDPAQWPGGHTYQLYTLDASIVANRHALVFAQNTSGLIISASHLLNSGLSAVFAYGKNTAVSVLDSWINQTGYSGIQWEGGWAGEGDLNHGHTVLRTKIEMTGRIVGHGRCLDGIAVGSVTVDSFECGSTPREGIVLLGECDSAVAADCYTKANTISHAYLHDTNNQADDSGAIYQSVIQYAAAGSTTAVNTYNQVLVDRVNKGPYGSYAASVYGLYFDIWSNSQTVANMNVTNYGVTPCSFNTTGHTLTNTSFTSGCAANGAFNDALMDYPNIGISYASHPYASASTQTFTEDFESGLVNWQNGGGSPALDTAHYRSATHAFKPGADGTILYHPMEGAQRSIATVWYYDDATSLTAGNIARADEARISAGAYVIDQFAITSIWRGLGVDTATSTGFYVAIYGSAEHVTPVARTTGLHAFTWNYKSGDHVDMGIDGTTVATVAGSPQWNGFTLGDPFSDGRNGPGWFDDISASY